MLVEFCLPLYSVGSISRDELEDYYLKLENWKFSHNMIHLEQITGYI